MLSGHGAQLNNSEGTLMSNPRQPAAALRSLSMRQQRTVQYARNVLHRTSRLASEAGPLLRWIAEFGPALGMPVSDDADDCFRRRGRREVPTAAIWRALQRTANRPRVDQLLGQDELVTAVGALLTRP